MKILLVILLFFSFSIGQDIAFVGNSITHGGYTLTWNGLDETLNAVSGGIYIYKLQIDNFVQTKKMVLYK